MIPNLKLVDEATNIWRGGQPVSPEDWSDLKANGIELVVKLNEDSEGSDNGAEAAGMTVYKVEQSFWVQFLTEPRLDDLIWACDAIKRNAFIHCTHGKNRTSLLVGMWRVLKQGWAIPDAYAEMIERGFHSPFPEPGLDKSWADFKTYWENQTGSK